MQHIHVKKRERDGKPAKRNDDLWQDSLFSRDWMNILEQ